MLKESCPSDVNLRIRIYDYDELSGEQRVTVYHYDDGTSQILPNEAINSIVTNIHIRSELPSNETFPGRWKRWADYITDVRVLDWISWQEAIENDVSEVSELQKIARVAFGGKCKTLSATCGGVIPHTIPVVSHEEINADQW